VKTSKIANLILISFFLTSTLALNTLKILPARADGGGDWWTSFGHDPTHGAVTTSDGPTTSVLAWSVTHSILSGALENVIIYDDVCYFPLNDGRYFALNASTGATIWENDSLVGVDQFSGEGFAYDSGMLYITSNSGWLYCFNATDGTQIWSASLGVAAASISNPAVANNIVYAGSNNHTLFAFAADNGAPVWKATMPAAIYTSPAIDSGMVFITSFNGNTSAFNAATGTLEWSYTSGSSCDTSPTVADGRVFSNDLSGNAVALDEQTGVQLWTNFTATSVSTAAVGYGYVYYPTTTGIFALDVTTGDIVWTYNIMADSTCSMFVPALSANRILYVSEQDNVNYLYAQIDALDSTSGDQLWAYNAPSGGGFGSPALANNTLITVDDIGEVFAWSAVVHGWKQYRYDNAQTGDASAETPLSSAPTLLWDFHDTAVDYIRTYDLVDVGGIVYCGFDTTSIPNFYALNATDGSVIWNYTFADSPSAEPAVDRGRVYIGAGTTFYALNASTGAQIWNHTGLGDITLHSAPNVHNNVVFFTSQEGSLYALDGTTGALVWEKNGLGTYVYSTPAIVGGVVYIASGYNSQFFYALNETDGAQLWVADIQSGVQSSPTVVGSSIYLGMVDGNVTALSIVDGTELWNYTTGDAIYGSPIVAGGKVFIGSNDKIFYALDASTGALAWSYTTDDILRGTPSYCQGIVYFATDSGVLYARNATNGNPLWSYVVGSEIYGNPVVVDGVIYVAVGTDYQALGVLPCYWFNFTIEDQNGGVIPHFEFTYVWTYAGNGSSFSYSWGDATLGAGVYDVVFWWHGVNLRTETFDTATWGNITRDFGPISFLPWTNGYIWQDCSGAIMTATTDTSNILNVTISNVAFGPTVRVSGFLSEPIEVDYNGTPVTFIWDAPNDLVTIPNIYLPDADGIFYFHSISTETFYTGDWDSQGIVTCNGSLVNPFDTLVFNVGDTELFLAVPNGGYVFDHWVFVPDPDFTDNPLSIDINSTVDMDLTPVFIVSASPAFYWLNFTFHDQNAAVISSSEFTLNFYNSSQLLSYTLGDTTLESGTYKVTFAWRGVDYGYQNYDTATFGNSTITITLPMLIWSHGYIALTDWLGTITINGQDDAHLNFTVSGASGPFNVTVSDYPKEPSVVKYNNTATDYTYSAGQDTVTTNSTALNGEFYLEPAAPSSSGGGSNTGNGGSWSTPITNAVQNVIDALKKIPPLGIFAIIAVLGLIAIGGMGNSKRKNGTPSRSFKKRR
jgi:outer membrane protein assembly factor BamB